MIQGEKRISSPVITRTRTPNGNPSHHKKTAGGAANSTANPYEKYSAPKKYPGSRRSNLRPHTPQFRLMRNAEANTRPRIHCGHRRCRTALNPIRCLNCTRSVAGAVSVVTEFSPRTVKLESVQKRPLQIEFRSTGSFRRAVAPSPVHLQSRVVALQGAAVLPGKPVQGSILRSSSSTWR